MTHALDWPSLTVQWLPEVVKPVDKVIWLCVHLTTALIFFWLMNFTEYFYPQNAARYSHFQWRTKLFVGV
jgi:hypothetical protein